MLQARPSDHKYKSNADSNKEERTFLALATSPNTCACASMVAIWQNRLALFK